MALSFHRRCWGPRSALRSGHQEWRGQEVLEMTDPPWGWCPHARGPRELPNPVHHARTRKRTRPWQKGRHQMPSLLRPGLGPPCPQECGRRAAAPSLGTTHHTHDCGDRQSRAGDVQDRRQQVGSGRAASLPRRGCPTEDQHPRDRAEARAGPMPTGHLGHSDVASLHVSTQKHHTAHRHPEVPLGRARHPGRGSGTLPEPPGPPENHWSRLQAQSHQTRAIMLPKGWQVISGHRRRGGWVWLSGTGLQRAQGPASVPRTPTGHLQPARRPALHSPVLQQDRLVDQGTR